MLLGGLIIWMGDVLHRIVYRRRHMHRNVFFQSEYSFNGILKQELLRSEDFTSVSLPALFDAQNLHIAPHSTASVPFPTGDPQFTSFLTHKDGCAN